MIDGRALADGDPALVVAVTVPVVNVPVKTELSTPVSASVSVNPVASAVLSTFTVLHRTIYTWQETTAGRTLPGARPPS
ncbi:MAG: hypothetical protein IH789_09325 [Acidobacteria bacterium]|nr:hypothetical protein [Acidobacteriota bacterium]